MGDDIVDRIRMAETAPLDADGKVALFLVLQDARAEIARLRDERRWIPVGERLPQPVDTVLMLMDGKDPVSGWYENGHFHNAYDQPNVTHWQPLPAPPKGGEVE